MTMTTVDELFKKAASIPPDTLDRLTPLGRRMKRDAVEWPRGEHMPEWHEAKKVASRLEVATTYDARTMFLDAYGVPVGYRTPDGEYTKVPAWARVLWALMTGDIVADRHRPVYPGKDAEDEDADVVATRLYRRDADMTCSQGKRQTWHEITDVQDELGIHKPSDRLANLDLWCRALARQSEEWLHHAILLRGRNGMWRMWERVHGSVHEFGGDDSTTPPPPCDIVLRIGGEDLETGIAEAERWVRWLCKDEDSAYNLSRWFAAPICAKYAHLAFILYGAGGNGKSLLFKELNEALGARVAPLSTDALTGRTTAFEQGQALMPIIGALWATLDENGSGEYDNNPVLKKLATGEPVHMRGVQRNMMVYKPVCTLAFGTNVPPQEGEASFARRFAIVDMVDGREAEDFEELLDFLRHRHGIAMMLAYSARHWGGIPPQEPGSIPPTDDGIVGAGGGADMKIVRITDTTTDPMAEDALTLVAHLLDRFTDNPTEAWVKAVDVPGILGVRELRNRDRGQLKQTLGMETGLRRIGVGGPPTRVWCVADSKLAHDKFMHYWERAAKEASKPDLSPTAKHAPAPAPFEPDGGELLTPGDLGFGAKYWPCGHDKVSRGWQQAYKNGTAHTTEADVYKPGGAYAVIPTDGYCVVDCDIVKSDPTARTGYDVLYELLGGEPDTTMVLTPSGGVHAYYKLPDGLRLSNAVNVGGSHIDLRVAGLGYVVGVLSTTEKGMYKPANQKHVGVMPAELVAWLRENGAVEAEAEAEAHTVDTEARKVDTEAANVLDGLNGLNPFGALAHLGGDDRSGAVDDWVVTCPEQVADGNRHGPVLEWSLRLIGDAADRHATEAQMAGLVRKMWSALGEYAEGAERARDTRLIFRGALARFGYTETILDAVGRN